jgi:hypothetical protein
MRSFPGRSPDPSPCLCLRRGSGLLASQVFAVVVVFVGLGATRPVDAAPITVPVEAALGPALYFGPGPLFEGTAPHYGLKIGLAAIIDQATIRRNIKRVPPAYRKQAAEIDELRVRPSIFIPDALIISPNLHGTGIVGATWRPLSLAIPLVNAGVRLRFEAAALLTYAFIWSDRMAAETIHFLRPGLEGGLRLEIPITDVVGVAMGANAGFYVPQQPGRGVFALPDEATGLDGSIWLLAQCTIGLTIRFPYDVDI